MPVKGHPELGSDGGIWIVPVYRVGNAEEDYPGVNYDVDLSKVTGISFTVEVAENKENFEGNIGGGLAFSCYGGDIGEIDSELHEKYNWNSKVFFGIDDDELGIYTSDKGSAVVGEKIGDYTYRFTANGFLNPLEAEDSVNSIDCMQVAIQEWGIDEAILAVTECNILDKDGNVLLSFDGLGYQKESSTEPITVPEYRYIVLEDGSIDITGYNGTSTNLEIPSEIDGKK